MVKKVSNNMTRDSSDFKFKNNDPFPKERASRMKSTLNSDYVKSQKIKKTGANTVVKKVLKKVPGPIGTVARLSGMPRKVSNAVKNAKTLEKVPQRKAGQPRMILGKVPKGLNMSQKQYDTVLGNALSKGIKKGREIRTKKETRGKAVATTQNINRTRYGKKGK